MLSFRDLIDRRVPHYLAIYLGAGWGLIEFTSFLEERYSFSPAWTDLVLFTWALLVPSVLLFTYNHGRPGRDQWARSEMVGIPLNLIIAGIVLTSAFSGRDLRATTTKVTVTDETGATIERTVARSEYRKRLALFRFDPASGDTAAAWLADAVPLALGIDMTQDLFLDVRSQALFREKLRDAGIESGQSVPLMLKRRIAQQLHLPYFVAGTVSTGIEGVTVRLSTYETATGSAIRERVTTHRDVLAAVDELSVLIRQDLGLPAARPPGTRDLPVAELLSTEPGAFRALVDGQAAAEREDWAGAERAFQRASELDPGFALAHYSLYSARAALGNMQAAIASLNAAMQHLYRLPERVQFIVKAENFFVKQDMEKAYAVARMMVDLYPHDATGHILSAQLEELRGENAAAIRSLRSVIELDPQRHETLLKIGSLQDNAGAFEDALATYRSYADAFPEDVAVLRQIAGVLLTLGRFNDARAALDRALLLDPSNVQAMTALALVERGTGDIDASWQRLQAALGEARTPEERVAVYSSISGHYQFTGRMILALDATERAMAALAEFQPPVVINRQRMDLLGRYARAGRTAQAATILEQAQKQHSPPFHDFWHIGQLNLGLELRDSAQIREGAAGVRRIIDELGIAIFERSVVEADAVLYEIRGDWDAALRAHERRLQLEPKALNINRDIARTLRMLDRPQDALRAIELHLTASPFSPESNIEAARIRLLLGDTTSAHTHRARAREMLRGADAGYRVVEELEVELRTT